MHFGGTVEKAKLISQNMFVPVTGLECSYEKAGQSGWLLSFTRTFYTCQARREGGASLGSRLIVKKYQIIKINKEKLVFLCFDYLHLI